MPELHEVFRMVTEKVDQDPGALERQIAKQRRATWNRRVGTFATVAVLVVATVVVFALTRGDTRGAPATPAPSPPRIGGSMVDLDTGQATPLPASIATAGTYYAVSPDHTMVAYSDCCSPPDPLYIANIDGTGIRQITAEGQDAYGAQWSPDGSMLLYQQRDASTQKLGNLFVQNVETGQRTQITAFDQTQSWDEWFTFPSFTHGIEYILFQLPSGAPSNANSDLWVVPLTGGTPILARRDAAWGGLAYGLAGARSDIAFSPVSKDDVAGGGLWIDSWDLRTVVRRSLVPEGNLTWVRWSPDGSQISYSNRGWIYVVNVPTGPTRKVAEGGTAEWFDDHTLIVGPGG